MEFWNRTKVDKKTFFNNLNYEVKKYYYSKKDIADYDILDYIEFREYYKKDTMYVDVQADIRVVRCSGGKVSSQYKLEKFTIKKLNRDLYILEDGANMIKCHNCGASIDMVWASSDAGATKLQARVDRQKGRHITEYAEIIGLGTTAYELIEI